MLDRDTVIGGTLNILYPGGQIKLFWASLMSGEISLTIAALSGLVTVSISGLVVFELGS